MPTRSEIRNRNRMRRKAREEAAKAFILLRNITISLILLIVIFVGVVVGAHIYETKNEIDQLKKEGLYNQVELDDGTEINVTAYGKSDSEHTIVTISGLGIQDFSVYAKHITKDLKDGVRVALIDRHGYGFSEDKKDITVAGVVETYREALAKAKIDGPYILLAHEFGSIYATEWAHQHEDEIEGIIYLDGAVMPDVRNEEHKWYESILYKLGFQRIAYHDYHEHESKDLTMSETECAKALNVHSMYTSAYLAELAILDNYQLKSSDVPKLYVSSADGFTQEKEAIEYFEYVNQKAKDLGNRPPYDFIGDTQKQEASETLIAEATERFNARVKDFASNVGHCHVAKMPGIKDIFEQKPKGVTEVIADFLLYINGEKDTLNDFYDDSQETGWEEYREQHKEEIEAAKGKLDASIKDPTPEA